MDPEYKYATCFPVVRPAHLGTVRSLHTSSGTSRRSSQSCLPALPCPECRLAACHLIVAIKTSHQLAAELCRALTAAELHHTWLSLVVPPVFCNYNCCFHCCHHSDDPDTDPGTDPDVGWQSPTLVITDSTVLSSSSWGRGGIPGRLSTR
jgi:hypothetical protein